jgi:hypothetical protein
MRFGVAHVIWCAICCLNVILVKHQIADAANHICDLQQIGHEIAHEIARVIRPLGREQASKGEFKLNLHVVSSLLLSTYRVFIMSYNTYRTGYISAICCQDLL